jgi:hypothetical protein
LKANGYDAWFVHTNLTLDPRCYGAPVFDFNGNMVGIVEGYDWSDCGLKNQKVIHGTVFTRLQPEMFEVEVFILDEGVTVVEPAPEVPVEPTPPDRFEYQPDPEPDTIIVEGRG